MGRISCDGMPQWFLNPNVAHGDGPGKSGRGRFPLPLPLAPMLERGDLWIGPWEPAPGSVPRPWRRLIRSPADDGPLGAVRFASPWPAPRRPWQPSAVLELVETGDQALVLTLRRS